MDRTLDLAPLRAAVDEVLEACGTAAVVVRRGEDVLLERAVGTPVDGRPFAASTPVFLYSAVKPMASLCVLVAAADSALDLDDRVAATWPAFACHGKGEVTIDSLGLPLDEDYPAFVAETQKDVRSAIGRLKGAARKDRDRVHEAVRLAARRAAQRWSGKKPQTCIILP